MKHAVIAKFHLDGLPMGNIVLSLHADQVAAFNEQLHFEQHGSKLAAAVAKAIGADSHTITYGARMLS